MVSGERSKKELCASSDVPPVLSSCLGQEVQGSLNGKGCGKGVCSRILTFSQDNNQFALEENTFN